MHFGYYVIKLLHKFIPRKKLGFATVACARAAGIVRAANGSRGVTMKPDEQQAGRKSKGWLIASLAVFISLIASILYSLPQFMRMYEEMLPGEPLPQLTRLFCAVPPLAYIGNMAAGVALLLFMHFSARSPRSCRRVEVGAALLSVMAFVVYVIALFLPLTKMIEKIGG